ncbi:MAG TPA: TolC family protein [Polyangiaceae bacterium]|nr:TolC family protein [Polyangiaceae bacterium]
MRRAALLTLIVAGVAHAEPPAPDVPALGLAQAIDYARAHQPAVRAAKARIASGEATAKIADAEWLPRLGVTAQMFAGTANQTTGSYVTVDVPDIPRIGGTRATATGSFKPYASTLVGVGANQEIYDFGRIAAERAAGDAAVTVERERALGAILDVTYDVEEAYFAVLAAKAVVKASEDAYERARAHRDFARAGVHSGLRPPIESTRAEAELARLDIGRIRAHGNVASAEVVFAATVGVPEPLLDAATEGATTTGTPGLDLAVRATDAAEMPALDVALKRAAEHDPEFLQALAELHAEEARTRAVGAALRPDLSLTASLTGRAGGAPPSGNGIPADQDGFLPNVPNWDVGAVFTWPLFDGVVNARKTASRAEERVRREEVAAVRMRETADVRRAYAAVDVARAALPGLARAVDAARANYAQADARFGAGLGTSVELADAESLRTSADIELALGAFELARARARFGRAIGEKL